jgi:hypothetical protein
MENFLSLIYLPSPTSARLEKIIELYKALPSPVNLPLKQANKLLSLLLAETSKRADDSDVLLEISKKALELFYYFIQEGRKRPADRTTNRK